MPRRREDRPRPRPRRPRRLTPLVALLAVTLLAAASAVAAAVPVRVSPAAGSSHQVFRVSMRRPVGTGGSGIISSYDTVTVAGPHRSGCVSDATVTMPNGPAATIGAVALDPRRAGGHWCTGTFRGVVIQYERSHCGNPQSGERPAVICPMMVVAPRTIARFRFVVR